MSLRVLHLLDHSIPIQTGYTFRTLSILREQRKLGWETFHLTTPKHKGALAREEDVDGWHFYRTPVQSGLWSRYLAGEQITVVTHTARRLAEVAREIQPHIIHAHSPVLNCLPALRVGRRMGIPVVYEIRAFWEDAAVNHVTAKEGGVRYRMTRWLETIAARRADHVTTICEGLRADLIARGIPKEKVTVIPNAVDPVTFHLDGEPDPVLRKRLNLEGCMVLGFVGSFYAYEGLDLAIEALRLVAQRQPAVKLLLVGGGPEENRLRRLATERGVQDRVVFAGRVPNAEVGKYYDLVDLLIYARHPMRLTELVTPLKPLEAMAQGRVFVASDVGGHRELVQDHETGFLFKAGQAQSLADAIHHVMGDHDMRERVRRAARRFVEENRTWTASVARYEEMYLRLTSGRALT